MRNKGNFAWCVRVRGRSTGSRCATREGEDRQIADHTGPGNRNQPRTIGASCVRAVGSCLGLGKQRVEPRGKHEGRGKKPASQGTPGQLVHQLRTTSNFPKTKQRLQRLSHLLLLLHLHVKGQTPTPRSQTHGHTACAVACPGGVVPCSTPILVGRWCSGPGGRCLLVATLPGPRLSPMPGPGRVGASALLRLES